MPPLRSGNEELFDNPLGGDVTSSTLSPWENYIPEGGFTPTPEDFIESPGGGTNGPPPTPSLFTKSQPGYTSGTGYSDALLKSLPQAPTGVAVDATRKFPWTTPKPAAGNAFNRMGDRPFYGGYSNQTVTQQKVLPQNIPIPQLPTKLPEYKIPERSESRISSLTQAAAAPGMRALRGKIREVQNKYYENPNVKRMTLRDALAGYGIGIENVMAGARRQAMQEYESEYAPQVQKAQTDYNQAMQRVQMQYQAAWQDYNNRIATQTTRSLGGPSFSTGVR